MTQTVINLMSFLFYKSQLIFTTKYQFLATMIRLRRHSNSRKKDNRIKDNAEKTSTKC